MDLSKVVCPRSHRKLRALEAGRLESLNEAIRGGSVRTAGGEAVDREIQAGLIVEGDEFVYPIADEIPILLPDEAIVVPDGV